MKTNEIFEHVLQIVCEECELCYGELINGANKNAVDARCLLICALVSLGFSEENTAAYLSMTRQGVERKKRFNIHFALCPDKYGILAVIFRFVVCLMM